MRRCGRCGAEFVPTAYQIRQRRNLCSACKYIEQEATRLKAVARNRAFIEDVNSRTICATCGTQSIEWHNPEHVELGRERYRIGFMVSQGRTLAAIQAELERCTPLCRRCHMIEDGRIARLPHRRGLRAPSPCGDCGRLYRPLRKGRCLSCYRRRFFKRVRINGDRVYLPIAVGVAP